MMRRRALIGMLFAALAARASRAQLPERVWRVGFFYFGSRQSASATGRYEAFVEGMRELGYIEGRNLAIEARFGESRAERLPGLAAELMRSKIDVIVATGSPVYSALRQANSAMPVVVTVTADPVLEGVAASLARPGGNFTGLSDAAATLGPKHLELLMAAVPRLARVGVLLNPDNGSHPAQLQGLTSAARKLGVQVVTTRVARPADIEPAFVSLAANHADAVLMFGDTFFAQQVREIAQVAISKRMPSIYLLRDFAQAGGLMSYGPDLVDNFRRAATYVDKILKGAKPGELPFEQPTRYLLAINLKSATALGLTLSQSLLLRADEVIQ